MISFRTIWFSVLVSLIAGQNSSLPPIQYTSLGCWQDTSGLAIPSLEGQSTLLSTSFDVRDHPIERCGLAALSFGDSVFGLQNGGECRSSINSSQTYKKYGASTSCPINGTGGLSANNVYKIIPPGLNANAPGVTWKQHADVEFSVSIENATFLEAKSICYSYGGTLALVKTNSIRVFLQNVNLLGTGFYWIGLSMDRSVDNGWYLWQDGTSLEMSQSNYAAMEPLYMFEYNQICIKIDSQQFWYTEKCDWKTRYICQRPAANTTTASATSVSSAATATTRSAQTKSVIVTSASSLAITTTPKPTAAIAGFCVSALIFVPHQNTSYTFPETGVRMTSVSMEHCPGGTPMATAACLPNVTHPANTYFAKIVVINCGVTLESVTSQVTSNNATTASVSVTMATLKILTTNTSLLSKAQIVTVAKALQALSQTDSKNVTIDVITLYDVLIIVEQISQYLSSSSPASDQKYFLTLSQTILNAMQIFINRVIFPADFIEVKLITNSMTIQINEPLAQSRKYSMIFFGSSNAINGTQKQAVTAEIPGTLLDQLQLSHRKNQSSLSAMPIRTSFILHDKPTFFPSKVKTASVLSIHIRGYQLNSTTVGINITFRNISAKQGVVSMKNGTLRDIVTRTQCSVYRSASGQWIPTGCMLVDGSSPPQCMCYKLNSFSLIVSTKVLPSAFALGIVSYVGCSLSILGLIITIWVYLAGKELRKRQPTTFLLNICFNLLVVNFIFLFGVGSVSNRIACYLLTALLHYFLLVTWFWMSANAYNMYKAFSSMSRIRQSSSTIASIICYLFPALMVLINSIVAIFYEDAKRYRPDDLFFESTYRARNMCWLRYLSLDLGFLLPVGILFSFNLICFISVVHTIACKKSKIQSTAHRRGQSEDIAIAIAICVIMGLTWVFGFLMMLADNVIYQSIMAWLFTIFNSMQGLFIFIMYCVRQTKVRRVWWIPFVALCMCRSTAQSRNNDASDSSAFHAKHTSHVASVSSTEV